MNVVVFAPHPDDDILGCGGSLALLTRAGHDVAVVYVTSGEAGGPPGAEADLGLRREGEARAAARVLGVGQTIFLRKPDGYVTCDRESLKETTTLIRRLRPDRIYIPHRNDAHRDHRATSELVLEAAGRAAGPWFPDCPGEPWRVGTILAYEVWTPLARIACVEDISPALDLKRRAMAEHASQLANLAYDEAFCGLNRYRGVMTGRGRYCECFDIETTDAFSLDNQPVP